MRHLARIFILSILTGCTPSEESTHLIIIGEEFEPRFESLQIGDLFDGEDIGIVDSTNEYGVLEIYLDGQKELVSRSGGLRLHKSIGKLQLDGSITHSLGLLHLAGARPNAMELISKSRLQPTDDIDLVVELD